MSSSWQTTYGDYGDGNDGDENDEADEETREQLDQRRDCLVYLIDASSAMTTTPPLVEASLEWNTELPETPFRACVAAAAAQFRNRIINDHHDRVAVVLFGCVKPNNPLAFAGIHVLQDLDEPSASRIQQLERLAGPSSNIFDTEIGSADSFVLHEAFWVVNTIFSKGAKKNDHKRVFLMTNTSYPHYDNLELQRLAITRAKDLSANGAIIYLFGLENANENFEFDKFYKDNIVVSAENSANDVVTSSFDSNATDTVDNQDEEMRYFNASGGGLEALTKRVEQKVFKKRTYFRCPMILGDGLEFGIRGYNLISEVKPSSYTYLVGATNEEAAVQTSYVCKTTSEQLGASDMDSYYLFGGGKAVFTKEEIAEIKHFGNPGLRLIGFKPLETILRKPYYNMKHSVFVVPDETTYTGSSSIFIQFLARIHAKDKAVICSFLPRKGSSPRVVALLPQMEEYDIHGNVIKPSGFHLIHVPFNDDLRKPDAPAFDINKKLSILEPAIKAFGDVIDKTTIKNFSVFNYQNPSLQKHYANLQAVALKKDAAEEVIDSTEPNNAAIMRRIAKFVPIVYDLLPEEEEEKPNPVVPKRKAAKVSNDDDEGGGSSSNSAAKKSKTSSNAEVSEELVKDAYTNATLNKLTVVVLTAFLRQKGVPAAKKKGDLVAQVEAFFNDA
ncbi:X-ray repair cross-complementing protein 6 [Physocladia obscura]|uniref:ATP-dependent DNA helicase II subunit 1 n=1 Tax=Physocladia obscura TaxID=109957 RepID=A0AAD5XKX2_9FUNG|nr:X-ray repair cross-complementing protein 6 [Physocladia obscura]